MRDISVIPLTVDRVRRRFNSKSRATPCPQCKNRVLCPVFREGSNDMANTAQARKRARQAETTRQRNASQKSTLRTAIRKVKKAIATGDKAAATATFHESQAVIDRIADKRIVHKNLASRTKSRLAQAIKALA
jgi:small subunit ribosomal protein S20